MKKVLVAEDDTFLSSLLVNELHTSGYDVVAAFDGSEAIEKVQSWQPDLVLLDLMMPNTDGYAVLEYLKQNPEAAKVVVVILSNLGAPDEIERVKKFNVATYMVKANTTPKEVVAKVQEFI